MRDFARHMLPRASVVRFSAPALTIAPGGGVELPNGFERTLRESLGQPTTTPEHDEAEGFLLVVQWLGVYLEYAIGKVS